MGQYKCPLCQDKGWVRFTKHTTQRVISYPVQCKCRGDDKRTPIERQRQYLLGETEDRSLEAKWLRETEETRREANYRPGQE